jgi:hypothetical protein
MEVCQRVGGVSQRRREWRYVKGAGECVKEEGNGGMSKGQGSMSKRKGIEVSLLPNYLFSSSFGFFRA